MGSMGEARAVEAVPRRTMGPPSCSLKPNSNCLSSVWFGVTLEILAI